MKKILILISLLSFFISSNAQTQYKYSYLPLYTTDKTIPSYIYIPNSRGVSFKKGVNNARSLCDLLRLNNQTTLLPSDTLTDSSGGFHESYKQFYNGLEIDGVRCTIHFGSDGFLINGNLKTIDNLLVKPAICQNEAESFVLDYVDTYMTKDFSQKKIAEIDSTHTSLIIFPQKDSAYLAYKTIVYSSIPEKNLCIFTDAIKKEILDVTSAICTATVSTKYSGIQSIVTQHYSDYYRLRDYTRGGHIITFQYNNNLNSIDYTSSDNTWANLSDYDRAALDAHWGVEKTYDYYLDKFCRNSYDNSGSEIVSYVNAAWPNAAWMGTFMKFGIINGYPLVCLDITAHELTHGVTNNTSKLTYAGESGAISEAISDIFAVCIERENKPQNGNKVWQIGEDAVTGGIRDLSNPACKYYKGNGWIDTSNPTINNDWGGVHTNSGIISYWFYLLAHGGSGTNQAGHAYNINGIGFDAAIQICYLANTTFFTSTSTFYDARLCSLFAAQQLGYGTDIITQVNQAWDAVGVYFNNIIGVSTVYSSATYNIPEIPDSIDVNWSLSGSNASCFTVMPSSLQHSQCTITRKSGAQFGGSASLVLTAQIMYNDSVIHTITKSLTAPYIDGPNVPCNYSTYSAAPLSLGQTVEWSFSGIGGGTLLIGPTREFQVPDNACVIVNNDHHVIRGTLTATVKSDNVTVATLTKWVSTGANFAGTWYQQAGLLPGDTLNLTPKDFNDGDYLIIEPGRKVYLQSAGFVGATITHNNNGMSTLGWTNNNGTISFTPHLFPESSVGMITINGTKGSCEKFTLRLMTPPNPIDDPILDPILSLGINATGSNYTFTLESEDETVGTRAAQQQWNLSIVQYETGRMMYDGNTTGASISVNTATWQTGIYIATATMGDKKVAKKIIIGG